MNLTLTCPCGKKLRLKPEHAGKTVICPGCKSKLKVPAAPLPDDEIKLQELNYPESANPAVVDEFGLKPINVAPSVKPVAEEDDDAGYGLDAKDGRADLDRGTGMYGTIAVVSLDEQAPCIAYGCKGDWALAGQGKDVLIMDMKHKKKVALFDEHEAEVTSVALSTTQPLALSGDKDGELRYWGVASCKAKKKIQAHDGAINAVALSPDGKFAATGGEDGCIHLWELTTGKRRKLEYANWGEEWDEEVTFVTFSRDGSKILAGGSEGRVSLWSVASGDRIKRYAGQELPISCVRLSDEGGRITATTEPIRSGGSSYLIICHWDAKTGKPIQQFNLAVDSVPCCITPDRGGMRVILAGGGSHPWMGVWSLENGRLLHVYEELRGSPLSLAVAPLNNRLLAALHNDRLQLFGLEPY